MQEIGEENKLIAKFMGYKYYPEKPDPLNDNLKIRAFWRCEHVAYYMKTIYEHEEFKFHSSWDWLAPVIKKCHDIGTAFKWETPERNKFEDIFYLDEMIYEFMRNDVKAVYTRVVNFIKWYNGNRRG